MDELLFPLAALALTFLVLVPALTLVSRAVLVRRRQDAASWAEYGKGSTYAWIVAPVLVPVAWLWSSALHEIEAGAALRSCFLDHADPGCVDTLLLLGLLLAGGLTLGARQLQLARRGMPAVSPNHSVALRGKLSGVVAQSVALGRARIRVVSGSAIPVYTSGLFRPTISVDACFLKSADDEIVLAALLHECAHIAGHDTLRVFVAQLCLRLNPLAQLLRPELDRWRNAREACCDGDAVAAGGQPLALAEGILRAARFDCFESPHSAIATLCGHDRHVLKLRLMLLMDSPLRSARSLGQLSLLLAVFCAITAPHFDGLQLLSAFHFEVERLLHTLV